MVIQSVNLSVIQLLVRYIPYWCVSIVDPVN